MMTMVMTIMIGLTLMHLHITHYTGYHHTLTTYLFLITWI